MPYVSIYFRRHRNVKQIYAIYMKIQINVIWVCTYMHNDQLYEYLVHFLLFYWQTVFDMQSFDYQICSFLRVAQKEADLLLYLFDSIPRIYLKHHNKRQIWKESLDSLNKQLCQENVQIIKKLFSNKQEVVVDGAEIHENHLILQLNLADKRETLIIPLQAVQNVGKRFQKVEMMYMAYRENYFIKEKETMLEEIATLREMLQQPQPVQSKIKYQQMTNETKLQQQSLLQKYQRRCKRLHYRCTNLTYKCNQLQNQLRITQDKLKIVAQINRNLENQSKQTQISFPQVNHIKEEINANNAVLANKSKYLVHHYQDCTRVTRANELNFIPKSNQTQISKSAYNNQFTDYFEAKQQNKPLLTPDGYNQFVFQPFTLGKYICYFQIRDRNIRFRQKGEGYYHITSFYGIPLTGRTKVGFQIVEMKANNIVIGIMLPVRKRLRYSFQQTNIVSYKMKGGKYGLYIDGSPALCACESVKKGQTIWMFIDRDKNTIAFQNEETLIKQMPSRFKTAALFPFITMKDPGDEVKVL